MPKISKKNQSKTSGLLSNPERVIIQEKDCITGSYPPISRTGDPDYRTGNYNVSYDDTSMIIFQRGVNCSFPHMLEPNRLEYISGAIATPNLNTDMTGSGAVIRGVSDVHIRFSDNSNKIKAFDESRVRMERSDSFYHVGTKNSDYPGFDSSLYDKTQIVINFKPTRDQDVVRSDFKMLEGYNPAGSTGEAANSEYAGRHMSGFCYFNWDLQRWDQIGITDPATGNEIYNYHVATHVDRGSQSVYNRHYYTSGTENFPSQFRMNAYGRSSARDSSGYMNPEFNGHPHINNFAPFSN